MGQHVVAHGIKGQHVAETEELLGSPLSKLTVQRVVEPVLWVNM